MVISMWNLNSMVFDWKTLLDLVFRVFLLVAVPAGYLWIEREWKAETVKVVTFVILMTITIFASYKVNMYAFEKEPVWLYNAENIMLRGNEGGD